LLLAACGGPDQNALTFDGPSTGLKGTVILATLDRPIPEGKNAIWCASFEAAWKALIDYAGEPIALEGDLPLVKALNDAPDVRSAIPADSMYSVAGDGATVRKAVAQNVPDASPWIVSQFADGYPAAYAFLTAEVPFPTPYVARMYPLHFTDASGQSAQVDGFGSDEEHSEASRKAVEQARVFSIREEEEYGSQRRVEYAVDLCGTSSPNQIVVALIPREASLRAAVEKVLHAVTAGEERLATDPGVAETFRVRGDDALAVPSLAWKVAHRFGELEGLQMTNTKLAGDPLAFAGQEVQFRLNREGAKLRSEALNAAASAAFQSYYFGRPFLIYMKKRGPDQPYFAMWVDNAELLQAWKE
jgi:hypothetical protein